MSAFSFCSSACAPQAVVLPRPDDQQQKPGWTEASKAMCNQSRPHPARRRSSTTKHLSQRHTRSGSSAKLQILLFTVLFCCLFCCQHAIASEIHVASPLKWRGDLIFDRSEPPPRPMRLQARQETTSSLPSSIVAPTTSSQGPPSTSSSSGATISAATPTGQVPLPTPFDSSLGSNFTAPSCPAFFETFLTNNTFLDCLPFSLLLQTSNGFFAAERSLVRLTQTLDASCDVNFTQCSAVMASLAQEIQFESNCGADLQLQNPMVLQAYNGFVAYQPLFHAGCLTDTDGNFCFANAVTNSSAPTSSYVYYLPLGVQLPAGTRPACDMCLQNTMAIFATAAGNHSVPLYEDYSSAAEQIDMICGPTFVEASVERTSAAVHFSHPGCLGLLSLFVVLLGFCT